MGRFLVLQEAASRRQARRQLLAMQAAAYPQMEERARSDLFRKLRNASMTQEELERLWDAGWKRLDKLGSVRSG